MTSEICFIVRILKVNTYKGINKWFAKSESAEGGPVVKLSAKLSALVPWYL